jgi:hypothetical protein
MRLIPRNSFLDSARNLFIMWAILSVAITVLMYLPLESENKTYLNFLAVGGFVAQILGLLITYIQINSVKEITKATEQQVKDSIELNNGILMISDLSKKIEMVNEIQGYLNDDKIELCILRMKDLKIILNSLKNQDQYKGFFLKRNFNDVFSKFIVDLDNLHAHRTKRQKFDKLIVIKNLEEISTLLSSVELKLKSPSYDK